MSLEFPRFRRPTLPAALGLAFALALATLGNSGCDRGGSKLEKDPDTLAVEEKAGDYREYYEQVVRLARVHAAQPDSFRIALDALPGSHLTDEEWEAWTRPYVEEPGALADHLEKVLADLASGRR
jgi:hypothetical protein